MFMLQSIPFSTWNIPFFFFLLPGMILSIPKAQLLSRPRRRTHPRLAKIPTKCYVPGSVSTTVPRNMLHPHRLCCDYQSCRSLCRRTYWAVIRPGTSRWIDHQRLYVHRIQSLDIACPAWSHASDQSLSCRSRAPKRNKNLTKSAARVALCAETINIVEGNQDSSSWLELWRSAVAVEKLCIQKGRTGVAFKQGT